MCETDPQPRSAPDGPEAAAETTGHPVVDEVLAGLDGLDALPVRAHAAVFQGAHQRLHEILTGPPTG
jgi:hypothetical protein